MGFLRTMVAATQAEIQRPGYPAQLGPRPSRRPPSLKAAIRRGSPHGALLVEFKRRSPGAGRPDLPHRAMDSFVRESSDAGVDGYSCLASRPEFGGSPEDVAELVGLTTLPVLYKDFIVDPRQVDAAARAGASAVLLIARLEVEGLLAHPLRFLAEAAHQRGLEVLLEWHGRAELRQTEDVPADVYGVNVRDLDTLEIHRSVAEETIRAADRFRPLVGMSGIEGPSDAARFWDAGVDGVLVGTALARARDPGAFLSSLRRTSSGGAR
jgi:indole-3-glycerol phosphate synthase